MDDSKKFLLLKWKWNHDWLPNLIEIYIILIVTILRVPKTKQHPVLMICFVQIVGNVLVLSALCLRRSVRSPSNLLIGKIDARAF